MGNEAQSSIYLRTMIRRTITGGNSGEALDNINTQELPDGAFCYVSEPKKRFRFRKYATDSAVSGLVVVPAAGGSGRWFLEGPPTGTFTAFARGTAANTALTGGGAIWTVSNTSNYELVTGTSNWNINPAGCILTYARGPECVYLVRAIATLTFATPDQLFFGVSFEGDLDGSDAGFAEGVQFTDSNLDAESQESFNMVTERLVVINAGEAIQPKFRLAGGGNTTTIARFTLSATPFA